MSKERPGSRGVGGGGAAAGRLNLANVANKSGADDDSSLATSNAVSKDRPGAGGAGGKPPQDSSDQSDVDNQSVANAAQVR